VLWIPWRTDIYEAKAALLACIKVKRKVIWFLKVMLLPLNVLEFNGKFSYLFLIGLANIKRLPISFCFCYCYILLVKREVNIAPYLIKILFYKKEWFFKSRVRVRLIKTVLKNAFSVGFAVEKMFFFLIIIIIIIFYGAQFVILKNSNRSKALLVLKN
jgi:hypothetical protein